MIKSVPREAPDRDSLAIDRPARRLQLPQYAMERIHRLLYWEWKRVHQLSFRWDNKPSEGSMVPDRDSLAILHSPRLLLHRYSVNALLFTQVTVLRVEDSTWRRVHQLSFRWDNKPSEGSIVKAASSEPSQQRCKIRANTLHRSPLAPYVTV